MNEEIMVDITGLPKAEVLKALYDGSHCLGLGFLQALSEPYTIELAENDIKLNECMYFDYLHGRVMKVDLSGDAFDPRLYDRDNYVGAAQNVIDRLRERLARQL